MKKFSIFLVLLILVGLGGGAAFLATWNIPAPSATVSVVVPNERFQQ